MISPEGLARLAPRAALLAAALLNARIVMGPIERLVARATIDDTFLYLQIARNWARLGVPTFDGEVVTSGFQPLWGALLAGLALFVRDGDTFVRAACLVCILLNLATGLLLVRLMERSGPPGGSLVVGGSWAAFMASPASISGMEAPLHGFLFAAALSAGLSRRRPSAAPVLAGSLLATAVLCRVDFAMVALPLAIWLGTRASPRPRVAAAIAPFAIIVPLGLWLFFESTGDVVPVSGRAKFFWARQAYPLPGWSAQVLDAARTALAAGREALQWMTGLRELTGTIPAALATAFGVVGLVGLMRAARRNALASMTLWTLAVMAVSALVMAMLLRQFAGGFWYYQPLRAGLAILAGFSVGVWPLTSRRAPWVVAAALCGAGAAGALLMEHRSAPNEIHINRVRAGAWLAGPGSSAVTGPVGSWNAGQLGYFASPHTVVSLDGFVQDRQFLREVLGRGDWRGYLARRGIRHLVDYNQRDSAQGAGGWDGATSFRGLVPLDCATVVAQFGQILVLDVSRWVSAPEGEGCGESIPLEFHP